MTQAVVQQNMPSNLFQLAVWIKDRKMQLNISKCSVIWHWFRSKLPSSPPDIFIDGAIWQMVVNQKYLLTIHFSGQHMFQKPAKMSFG